MRFSFFSTFHFYIGQYEQNSFRTCCKVRQSQPFRYNAFQIRSLGQRRSNVVRSFRQNRGKKIKRNAFNYPNNLNIFFKLIQHNLLSNNCHDHVNTALNIVRYKGKADWTNPDLIKELCLNSKYVSTKSLINTWKPFMLIVGLLIFIFM